MVIDEVYIMWEKCFIYMHQNFSHAGTFSHKQSWLQSYSDRKIYSDLHADGYILPLTDKELILVRCGTHNMFGIVDEILPCGGHTMFISITRNKLSCLIFIMVK